MTNEKFKTCIQNNNGMAYFTHYTGEKSHIQI